MYLIVLLYLMYLIILLYLMYLIILLYLIYFTRVHAYLFINMINLVLHLMRPKVWRYGDVVGVLKHKKILASADLRGPQARVKIFLCFNEGRRPEVKTKKILIAMLYGLMLEISIFLRTVLHYVSFSLPVRQFIQNFTPDRLSWVRIPQKFAFARY